MTDLQIDQIIEQIKRTQPLRTHKTHPWVTQDGPYDHNGHMTRVFIYDGFAYYVASKMWVDDEVANKRLDPWMQVPWGTYRDLPPKPPKK